MKRMLPTLLAALLITFVIPAVAEETEDYAPPEDKESWLAEALYQASTFDGALHRVAEYEDASRTPILRLDYANSPYSANPFILSAERLSHNQQAAAASLDVNRAFGMDLRFNSLLHRLDHDPLENLQAVSDVKTTRSTDFEPGVEYRIRRQQFNADIRYKPPAAPWLSLRAGLREERRDGVHQVLAVSHCTSCHVTAQGREVDESTTDISVGAHARFGRVDLDYELLSRQFEETGETPLAPYERAYHPGNPPGTLALPFQDRLWLQDGEFAVEQIPESEKLAHKAKIAVTGETAHSAQFTFVRSDSENADTALAYTFTGYRGRYQWRPRKNLRLVFYGRRNEIENDAIKVNLLDMNGLTSAPMSGYGDPNGVFTYQRWRRLAGSDPNINFTKYIRESGLDRTDDRLGVDAYWRPIRRGSLRLGYEYRKVDRDNVVLADETGETTSHRLRAGWNQRFGRRVRWHSKVEYLTLDNAYVNVDGGGRALLADPNTGLPVDLGAGSPKSSSSLQYYQLHALRVADLTNIPSEAFKLRSQATWAPSAIIALTGNARYRDAENDDLDYSTWAQEAVGVGVSFWHGPLPGVQVTLGADWQLEETDTRFHVPLMDG